MGPLLMKKQVKSLLQGVRRLLVVTSERDREIKRLLTKATQIKCCLSPGSRCRDCLHCCVWMMARKLQKEYGT